MKLKEIKQAVKKKDLKAKYIEIKSGLWHEMYTDINKALILLGVVEGTIHSNTLDSLAHWIDA